MLSSRSRFNVAAQACETCRRRKAKCDELKPRCTLCQRLNVECHYEESPAVKKEDNFTRVFDFLSRLEQKIDTILGKEARRISFPSVSAFASASESSFTETPGLQNPPSNLPRREEKRPVAWSAKPWHEVSPYFSVPHRVVVWPAVKPYLMKAVPSATHRLSALSEGGTAWLVALELSEPHQSLPMEDHLLSVAIEQPSRPPSLASTVQYPALTTASVQSYTNAYFNTFNVVYPILDELRFTSEVLRPVIANGFRYGHADSVLTLLVLALGQLALDSSTGAPVNMVDGTPSGVCGGSAQKPPGLDIFNEARARIGSLVLGSNIVSVQILVLQATYFEANACYVEYWRSIVSASIVCQVLIRTPLVQQPTLDGDLIRRAFWACVLDENLYHIDLDLPRTELGRFVDRVQIPSFPRPRSRSQGESESGERTPGLLEFYFSAKISLQRVIVNIHDATSFDSSQSETLSDYEDLPISIIEELSRQLEAWRENLPTAIQWLDNDLFGGPREIPQDDRQANLVSPVAGTDRNSQLRRTGSEILTAELRARFYYARWMLGRPFIFKALHFTDLMDSSDAEYCALAIQAACLWPSALGAAQHNKRLLPHLFTWTQNFIAILVVLFISKHNEFLGKICSERFDERWIEGAARKLLHWMKDVKQIDGIAQWSWPLLEALFQSSS